jgi:crotonobetainyl-CoA hydratase
VDSATPTRLPPVVLSEQRGNVLVITINRPEVRNAVNIEVWRGIGRALVLADENPEIRAVVLTGAGDKAFCAGADLKALSRGEQITPTDPVEVSWGFAGYVQHRISKPTIAAVNGPALGGGTELTLASDLAVAADNAIFGLPEVTRGILAAAGGVIRLPLQVPTKVAMEMILTGAPITAQKALELGLVNAVVPQSEVLEAAIALAERICANAPLAVQASKRIAMGIRDGIVASEDAAWALNERETDQIMLSADAQEGPLAFAAKRAPVWQGR